MSQTSLVDRLRKNLERKNFNFKTFTAMLLFGAIILVFVLFNDYGMMRGEGLGTVATVNNRFVSSGELVEEVNRLERNFSGLMGGQMGDMQRQFLVNQALEYLIQTELLSQAAEKQRIFASDEEIRRIITTELPYFQENGLFRRDRYEAVLNANRMTPSSFEARLRKDRKIQHLREIFSESSQFSTLEAAKTRELETLKLKFDAVVFDRAEAAQLIKISGTEVFERIKSEEFNKTIEEYFRNNIKNFEQPEEIRAAHILIKVDAGVPGSDKKALEKIQDLKKRAEKEDFGQLAAQFSEDLGSKTKKGDLGFFTRGRMVPEFENVAFGLEQGKLSEPVQTPFGYHLIKVTDRKAAKPADLNEQRPKIAERLIAEEKLDAELKAIEEALRAQNFAEVETRMKGLGRTWKTSPAVALSAPSIPGIESEEAVRAAFSLSPQRKWSGVVRDGGKKWIVRLAQVETVPVKADSEDSEIDRGGDRLNRWLDQLKKTAKIERHVKDPSLYF